jgi:hypothetical protein
MSEERKQLIIDPRTRQYLYIEYTNDRIRYWDLGRYAEIVARNGMIVVAPMRGLLIRDIKDVMIWSVKIAMIGVLTRFNKENFNILKGLNVINIDPDTYQYIVREVVDNDVVVRVGEYERIRGDTKKVVIDRVEKISPLDYDLEKLGVIAVAESSIDVIVHHNIAKARGEQ